MSRLSRLHPIANGLGRFRPLIALAAAALLLLAPSAAWAHRVLVDAFQEGDRLFIEGFFPDGRPTVNTPVKVLDQAGQVVAEGKTDAQGQLSLKPTGLKPGRLTVVLEAGLGHRAEVETEWAVGSADRPDGQTDRASPSAHRPHKERGVLLWPQALAGLVLIFGGAAVIKKLLNRKKQT